MKQTRREAIEARICQLKCDLGDKMGVSEIGDWKLSKYNEYIAAGLEAPFDIQEYHDARQAARDEINELQEELDDLDEDEEDGTDEVDE